jgi:hypothetical protein
LDPITIGLLAGAGLGALKSSEEKNMWGDQQKAEAEKTRYSAWTGMHGNNLAPPDGDMANVMAGAAAGAAAGQKWDASNTADAAVDETPTTNTNRNGESVLQTGTNQSNLNGAATGDSFEDYLSRKHTNVDYLNNPRNFYSGRE